MSYWFTSDPVPALVRPVSPVSASDHKACGFWRDGEQWWDINGEHISDTDLRKWIKTHFPEESSWAQPHVYGVVAYHTCAYAHRRRAISEFMKAVEWSGRELVTDDLQGTKP